MYTPPILNKKAPAYERLDRLFSVKKEANLTFVMDDTKIVISRHDNVINQPFGRRVVFTEKDLQGIHPDMYALLKLRATNEIETIKDTWDFWKKYYPGIKTVRTTNLTFKTGVQSVSPSKQYFKKSEYLLVITSEIYQLTEVIFPELRFYLATKATQGELLTRKDCNQDYPGLLDTALAGFALGLSSEAILQAWKSAVESKIIVEQAQCLLPLGL